MGSFDPGLSAMTNITFVGTHLINGKPANDMTCITGFDQRVSWSEAGAAFSMYVAYSTGNPIF
jgi:hypothetical protein